MEFMFEMKNLSDDQNYLAVLSWYYKETNFMVSET
jgi:hypothetical protein